LIALPLPGERPWRRRSQNGSDATRRAVGPKPDLLARGERADPGGRRRFERAGEGDQPDLIWEFRCECAHRDCLARVALTTAEYEQVRADPTGFLVAAGHELASIERVVQRSDRFTVVTKFHPEPIRAAIEHDPRRHGSTFTPTCRAQLGKIDEARTLAAEALELIRAHVEWAGMLGLVNPVARQLGIRQQVRNLVEQAPENPWRDAALAGANGDFSRAADLYARMGAATLEAEARLCAAEELIEAGRRAEGEAELQKALHFYRTVGATRYIQHGEALRAASA
jgi:hypothetical protein